MQEQQTGENKWPSSLIWEKSLSRRVPKGLLSKKNAEKTKKLWKIIKIPQVYLSFIVNHTCSYSIYQLEMWPVSNLRGDVISHIWLHYSCITDYTIQHNKGSVQLEPCTSTPRYMSSCPGWSKCLASKIFSSKWGKKFRQTETTLNPPRLRGWGWLWWGKIKPSMTCLSV